MPDPPEPQQPSLQARAAFWLGILNTGGLMLLGSYCLKGTVDHAFQDVAGAIAGAILAWWRS